jgi:hypothetical protein
MASCHIRSKIYCSLIYKAAISNNNTLAQESRDGVTSRADLEIAVSMFPFASLYCKWRIFVTVI